MFMLKNNDWGSDTFQEKFIKEYYKTTNESSEYNLRDSEKNKRKRKSCSSSHNLNNELTCDKKQNNNNNQINKNTNKRKKKKKHSKIKPKSQCSNLKKFNEKEVHIDQNNLKSHKLQPVKKKLKTNIQSSSQFELSSEESNFTKNQKATSIFQQRSLLLREKAMKNIQAAKFRLLNEKLYSVTGHNANKLFQEDTDSFYAYHQGYQSQVNKWPINPVDIIIKDLREYSNESVIVDLGCGDAKIAQTFPRRKVHSFDLVALNDRVTRCDISKVPLENNSVDIAIFCLSLMGTNLSDYISEAHRILKFKGVMKIAEVESRYDDLESFIKAIETHGFTLIEKDESYKMFVLLDFNKVKKTVKKSDMPDIVLNPCLYKKR